jgi:hypothetical protein
MDYINVPEAIAQSIIYKKWAVCYSHDGQPLKIYKHKLEAEKQIVGQHDKYKVVKVEIQHL